MTTARPTPLRRGVVALAASAVLLTASCSGDDGEADQEPTAPATSAPPPRATEPAAPEPGRCYRLDYEQAVSPTPQGRAGDCAETHTAETYAVGELDTVVDGHLLAVDSRAAQEQVATRCPEALPEFVGASLDQLRLTMLRPVWFTPTLEEADAGARWYRCDVLAVAADEELLDVDATLQGALAGQGGRDAFGMCGTAAPDAAEFERVICVREHSWRAIEVVPLPAGAYPGEQAVQEAGQSTCEDAGNAVAEDPLDFQWGYEWPTAEQWDAGQTFGRCWAPDPA